MVKNYPGMSEDVLQLILLHHGSKSGVGLTSTTMDKLPELVKIFMICQELATSALSNTSKQLEEILYKLQRKYHETQFERVVENFLNFSEKKYLWK